MGRRGGHCLANSASHLSHLNMTKFLSATPCLPPCDLWFLPALLSICVHKDSEWDPVCFSASSVLFVRENIVEFLPGIFQQWFLSSHPHSVLWGNISPTILHQQVCWRKPVYEHHFTWRSHLSRECLFCGQYWGMPLSSCRAASPPQTLFKNCHPYHKWLLLLLSLLSQLVLNAPA